MNGVNHARFYNFFLVGGTKISTLQIFNKNLNSRSVFGKHMDEILRYLIHHECLAAQEETGDIDL